MVNYCHDNNFPVESIEKHVDPEPVEYCLHTIKSMIHNVMDKTNASEARIFLTGEGNYREQIDSRYPYKGHRSPEKPTHFEAAKKYLIERFDAEVVDGCEADDAMGVAQWGMTMNHLGEIAPYAGNDTDETIICTTDKDLNMIPGWHYNFQKDEKYWVDGDEADLFFYKQLLTGDSVDNIKGIKGIGPVKAEKLLQDCKNNYERYIVCKNAYESAGMDYYDLLENANLLWIQREKDVLWTPPL
jgi:5'-3' exonuclease